jgi:hypothetical protein
MGFDGHSCFHAFFLFARSPSPSPRAWMTDVVKTPREFRKRVDLERGRATEVRFVRLFFILPLSSGFVAGAVTTTGVRAREFGLN